MSIAAPPAQGFAERLLPEVRVFMDVQQYESGAADSHFLASYRGRLRTESHEAYQRLEPIFARAGSTILLRQDGETQILLAVEELKARKTGNPLVNVLLFLATFATVLYVGVSYA